MPNLSKPLACLFALLVISVSSSLTTAQTEVNAGNQPRPLSEIRLQDRGLLIVKKSTVISAVEVDRAIIEMVLKADPEQDPRYRHTYGTIAKRLNKYIRKHQSLSAASDLNEADFVIFFSLVEYRRILNTAYPFGELFIILKGEPASKRPPRIVWKSRKILWAGDAINEFIRDLKNIRGES